MKRTYIQNWLHKLYSRKTLLGIATVPLLAGGLAFDALGTEPCGDFGECKTLIEINASDGDIGFHFLMDGDDLLSAQLKNPDDEIIFQDFAYDVLADQYMTETFIESAEPPCWWKNGEDWDKDDVVDLEEFIDRWQEGAYTFEGVGDSLLGSTDLTHKLPAAPEDLMFVIDGITGHGLVSWQAGVDLGECATENKLTALVNSGKLPQHPKDVAVAAWEVVFEPDDGSGLKYSVRVPVSQLSVTVPADYLSSLGNDIPAKIEVGAIGEDDNATFSEEGDFCINEDQGCAEEEE